MGRYNMNLDFMLETLDDKDTSQAFENLKELELISDKSNILYPYLNTFTEMVSSKKYVVRVRGFRLFCKQAKWDINNIINKNLDSVLTILNDDKPTAVRQALTALQDVVLHKKELQNIIKDKVLSIDYLRYKDTMHGLISKDIQNLLEIINKG